MALSELPWATDLDLEPGIGYVNEPILTGGET